MPHTLGVGQRATPRAASGGKHGPAAVARGLLAVSRDCTAGDDAYQQCNAAKPHASPTPPPDPRLPLSSYTDILTKLAMGKHVHSACQEEADTETPEAVAPSVAGAACKSHAPSQRPLLLPYPYPHTADCSKLFDRVRK